jgi:hypothetical protein
VYDNLLDIDVLTAVVVDVVFVVILEVIIVDFIVTVVGTSGDEALNKKISI